MEGCYKLCCLRLRDQIWGHAGFGIPVKAAMLFPILWHTPGKSEVSTPSGGFFGVKVLLGAEDFAYVSFDSGQDGASGPQEEV